MSWTDPLLTEGDPWHGVGLLNQVLRAINERREGSGDGSPPIDEVAEGDVVQGVSFLAGLQEAALIVLQRFQDPATMDVTPGAIPSHFAYALDWAGDQYTAHTAMDAAGLSDGFTRKRPREIEDLGDTGESGQVARFVGVSGDTRIYTHDGSAWSLADDQTLKPDTIEVDSAFPRYIEEGDYITPTFFNELQDLLQVARVVVFGLGGVDNISIVAAADTVRTGYSGGFVSTAAAAKAAADADWPSGSVGVGSDEPCKFSAIDEQSGPTRFRAWAYARDRAYTNPLQSGTYSYTQTAELVGHPIAYGFFGHTYEGFGQGMVEGDLFVFDQGDFNDAGDELVLGGSSAQPTWESTADGVEGWGWDTGGPSNGISSKVSIVNIFNWEFN